MSNLEPFNAEDMQVLTCIAEYGRPLWLAHMPRSIRQSIGDKRLNQLLEYSTVRRVMPKSANYTVIERWCSANVGAEINVKQLCAICGLTPPTIRKYLANRIDLFRQIARGKWIIRDPQSERNAAK